MSVQIRKAKVEDAYADELSEQNVIKMITMLHQLEKGIYLVAEQNGKIIGHAFLEPLPLKSICHVAQLSIGVHQGWQEKGIGTALMQKIIDWAKQSEMIEKIELNVRASNSRAIALYKKMGFIEEGWLKNRIKIKQGHYVDDILMALNVTK